MGDSSTWLLPVVLHTTSIWPHQYHTDTTRKSSPETTSVLRVHRFDCVVIEPFDLRLRVEIIANHQTPSLEC